MGYGPTGHGAAVTSGRSGAVIPCQTPVHHRRRPRPTPSRGLTPAPAAQLVDDRLDQGLVHMRGIAHLEPAAI
jgi:hypothetical protein